MLTNYYAKWRQFENYHRALLLVLPITLVLLLYLLSVGGIHLLLSSWIGGVIVALAFCNTLVGGAGRIGRLFDYSTLKKRKIQWWSNVIGITIGVVFGIFLLTVGTPMSFVALGIILPKLIFITGRMNNFSSLGNRIGALIDNFRHKEWGDHLEMALIGGCMLIGGIGATIIVCMAWQSNIVISSNLIITSLPLLANKLIFVVALISIMAALGDYLGRALRFMQLHITIDNLADNPNGLKCRRQYEYTASFIGVNVGLILGGSLVFTAIITGGMNIGLIWPPIYSICVTASLLSRIGQLIDRWERLPNEKIIPSKPLIVKKEDNPELVSPRLTPTLTLAPNLNTNKLALKRIVNRRVCWFEESNLARNLNTRPISSRKECLVQTQFSRAFIQR